MAPFSGATRYNPRRSVLANHSARFVPQLDARRNIDRRENPEGALNATRSQKRFAGVVGLPMSIRQMDKSARLLRKTFGEIQATRKVNARFTYLTHLIVTTKTRPL